MLTYTVIRSLRIPHGTVVALSPKQAQLRSYGITALGQAGWFKATTELCFKVGETLGFETPPAPRFLQHLQRATLVVESEGEGEQKVAEKSSVPLPAEQSPLEQMALQRVHEDGFITIQRYQAACRGIPRRTLQRALKGLVDKNALIKEGATHHTRYALPG